MTDPFETRPEEPIEGEPIIRDRRRIDPQTGEVREPQRDAAAPAPADDAAAAPGAAPGEAGAEPDVAAADGAFGPSAVEIELAERTADLKRLQAEYVNYKRRVDRDREAVREASVGTVLSALLPVLDDVDRARDHGELEGGFKAVADSLERSLSGLGLVRFGEAGEEFDPRVHEALMHAHSEEVDRPTCQAILQAGYRIGARVLRPARVSVVEPGESTGSAERATTEED